MKREDLRNIAIIAHVDHGKTTLVDGMLRQCGSFRSNQVVEERVMDNNDLERERGITILAKNTSVNYRGVKINIVDTPGHADFGGEVERVLKMIDGVLLLVDAYEGPMPQTRFVLKKALELNLKVIVVINKADRPDARIEEVEYEILELLSDLGADEKQLDFKAVYCSGKKGWASLDYKKQGENLFPLLDTVLEEIPCPEVDENMPFQMLVSAIDYNDYVGRIAIGRIQRGKIKQGQEIIVASYSEPEKNYKSKIVNLYTIDALSRVATEEGVAGDIVCVTGIENITIGDTICDTSKVEPLKFVNISESTLQMEFSVNDSPFAGREGKFVTSRNLRERLYKELLKDVSLKVEDGLTTESFIVSGRGEIHLSILIETMRREGYEFQVGNPKVMYKTIDGVKCEPIERVYIDVPENCVGSVMEKLGSRKGELSDMQPSGSRIKMEFLIPSRCLLGYRNEFLTDTRGEGIMNTVFECYAPFKGEINKRLLGSLIAFETGTSSTYGLYNAQERGMLFIGSGVEVYEGMIVGYSPKGEDIAVNVCKKKHVTNMRAAGSDEALRLNPIKKMSLEESIEFIADDELLEITPKNIRMRKKILDNSKRLKESYRKQNG